MTRLLLLAFIPLLMTGCLQTRQPHADLEAQQRALEERQRRQQMEEVRRNMQMQLEDSETQLTEARQEIRELRAEVARRPDADDLNTLGNRVAALEQMIQQMEAQRQRDRQEIVDTLSQKMAAILASQQAARSSGRTHEVAAGETLSAIAAAYRVSSQSIIQANHLNNPNALRIGQKLVIPTN